MKTFRISNGDLVLGSGGYEMVDGGQKVVQDLSLTMREPIGTDRFHPKWGSILDDFIGLPSDDEVSTRVRTEVHRVVQNYMVAQSQRISTDADSGNKQQVRPEEIVTGITNIAVRRAADRLLIKVTLETASGDTFDILRTVS